MSRKPIFGVWGHSGAQNGPGRENPIWTCFVTATWQFWTKNGVKSAFLVGLRQNKAQKWWKHVKICLKRSFSGVWVYSGARMRSKWRNAVSCASEPKHLWKKPGCCGECQNGSRLPNKIIKGIFWRVFIISGLYFTSNRPEMHFLHHF